MGVTQAGLRLSALRSSLSNAGKGKAASESELAKEGIAGPGKGFEACAAQRVVLRAFYYYIKIKK